MCGIVGYLGEREAYPIIIKGLQRLEYRGYDSAGVALQQAEGIALFKCKGKVANLEELVVKEVHGSGGYGMLIGPTSSKKEIRDFRVKLENDPENYIAQPTLALSTCPIFTKKGLAPRHVDLRPFVLCSPDGVDITPGGLTRVALKKGSLVVNSSQGGGTKDSWVLDD